MTRIKPPVAAQLPGGMALGATRSSEDARRVGGATGELLAALGINMNYAPDCDVNSEPGNPVIGVRSAGDEGAFVGRIASAVALGLRENQVIPCVKHFPGHGDTTVDSHYGLPVISKEREELEACELIPFRRAAAEGIEAVMTAHIVVPSVDADRPASLSKNWMDMLRGKLQYNGLIVSDCLEMDAVRAEFGTEKGAAMAIGSGTDCAMICHTFKAQVGAVDEVFNDCKSGVIPIEQILKSISRVNELKDKFASWDKLADLQPQVVQDLRPKHHELATEIYARSVTVIRDEQKALPLSPASKIVYMYPFGKFVRSGVIGGDDESAELPCTPPAFVDILRSHSTDIAALPLYDDTDLDEATQKEVAAADVVILATRNAKLSPKQTEIGLKLNGLAKKLVVVATCDPYDFMDNPEVKTVLATYEPTVEAFLAVARVIFSENKASGILPVLTTRDQLPIEPFDAGRDLQGVIALWHELLPQYAVPADRLSDLLPRSNGKHFIVRSKDKLVGFVATYVNDGDSRTAFISVLLVDSDHRSRGVGMTLISHARQYLRETAKAQQITIGSAIPRFWPGVPLDTPDQVRSFFVHQGFCPTQGPSARDYFADLTTYQPPAGILERAAQCGIEFVPWSKDQYSECMYRQREIFGSNPTWVDAYERLHKEDQHAQALVAIDTTTGKQVGWTLMQEPGMGMAKDLAFPPLLGPKTGQIGCVGVHPDARKKGVGLALIACAAMDLRRRDMQRVFIDWVAIVGWYEKAGFEVWREYRPMVLNEMR